MKKAAGFTLVELMIVVVIVAILAAFAFPAYQDYIRKSRRADGMNYLLNLQTEQEKFRASNVTYGNAADIGAAATSPEGFYNITVANNTATGYTLTATGQGDQANDTGRAGSVCTLVLTVTNLLPRGQKTPADCWN